MSWLDKIKNNIIITCGDGKPYSPSWLNATKDIEWHIAQFDFPGQDGTLVKRNKKMGTKYSLELFFQGDNHLDLSTAFEASANDSRVWKIQHPFYGVLNVQIQSFHIDNTGYNISKWSGVVIETILESNPITSVDPVDDIAFQKENLDTISASEVTAIPQASDIADQKQKLKTNFNLTVPVFTVPSELENYFNLFHVANSALNNLVASPLIAMQTTIAVITAPASFTAGLTNKLNLLQSQFQTLRSNITGVTTPAQKQMYQSHVSTIISSASLASSTPDNTDYTTNSSVYDVIDQIIALWNQFIIDLDLLQTANGGLTTSFIPSQPVLFGLSNLINTTLSNLFSIALNAKIEYTYITEKDTNFILLAHRFYGLDANDNNIALLMSQNNLGLNGILQIPKGTAIKYYI